MRISDWSSDVCSSDLGSAGRGLAGAAGNVLINGARPPAKAAPITQVLAAIPADEVRAVLLVPPGTMDVDMAGYPVLLYLITSTKQGLERSVTVTATDRGRLGRTRSEEHTSELQSLMRSSYAVFCLKKQKQTRINHKTQLY